MRLPLRWGNDVYPRDRVTVVDAANRIILQLPYQQGGEKVAQAFCRAFNRNWRYRFFGAQPYEYTREDWLLERNQGGNAKPS